MWTEAIHRYKRKQTRIGGVCGILIPIVLFLSLACALSYSPWFNWTQHALSDLGISGVSSFFFNSGMVICGILAFIFSLGLSRILVNKIGVYLLCISSLAMIGIGIFPETIGGLHFVVSATSFMLLTVSLLIVGLTITRNKTERPIGILVFVFIVPALIGSLILLPSLKGIAISETLVWFPAFFWMMIYGLRMMFF